MFVLEFSIAKRNNKWEPFSVSGSSSAVEIEISDPLRLDQTKYRHFTASSNDPFSVSIKSDDGEKYTTTYDSATADKVVEHYKQARFLFPYEFKIHYQ